jgi:excisionase family DNA binding protein
MKRKSSADQLAEQGLLTVAETSRFLRVSRSTTYNLMNHGLLPWVKIGQCRRIPRAAVVEFVSSLLERRADEYPDCSASFGGWPGNDRENSG